MSRRFLAGAAATFAVLLLIGLLGVDRMLVLWIHDSGLESLPALTNTLNALDTISGLHVWYWLAGCITLALGAIGLLLARGARWPRAGRACWWPRCWCSSPRSVR